MIKVGQSKVDITCYKEGVGMMGYGMYYQVVKGIKTPLYARTFVFEDAENGKQFAMVYAEILSCSTALKRGIIKKLHEEYASLGFDYANVMISGTHTHSAPGGYFHYSIYNMSIPGFVQEVYEGLVEGIVKSIVDAFEQKKDVNLYFSKGTFEPGLNVAFNRSLKAYNKNPEVKKLKNAERHLAVNRDMCLLKIEDHNKVPVANINWFGVHTTSVGNDLFNICSDNKGYAAEQMEKEMRKKYHDDYLATFAQGACGDVSPNFVWDAKRNRMRGQDVDDYVNAKENGSLQSEKAIHIHENMNEENEISTNIDHGFMFVDFTNVEIDPEFAFGEKGHRTGPSALGLSFFEGATDGRGLDKRLRPVTVPFDKRCKVY